MKQKANIQDWVWQCVECGQVSRDALTYPPCQHNLGKQRRWINDPADAVNPRDLFPAYQRCVR